MKPENKRPVTIEDLLRLKRTERPPAEFWSEFERQLRAKQLAALVEKRPWWQSFPVMLSGLSRHRVPFGAAAAFALTILVVREYRSTSVPAAQPAEAFATQDIVLPVSQSVAALPAEISLGAFAPTAVSAVPEIQHPATAAFVAATELPLNPAVTVPASISVDSKPPASALAAMGTVGSLRAPSSLDGSNFLASPAIFDARPVVASVPRNAIDPLRLMNPPGESRRARFLTAMVSSASVEAQPRTSERAANRIAEERLYDQVSRFGARGDRLQVKF